MTSYRSYIDNPSNFDYIGGISFSLLIRLGLRAHHKVGDIGCGPLRVGKLLIPYLNAGCYYGLDPNAWLVEEGIKNEVGADLIQLKKPQFIFNEDFDLSGQGAFDFLFAHSIFTHTYPALAISSLQKLRSVINPEGLFVFTLIERPVSFRRYGQGWLYPECLAYEPEEIRHILTVSGWAAERISWPHINQQWYVARPRP